MDTNFNHVIDDLYRLGFLGNFMPISKVYRWQHKGDERVILTDEWRLFVHYALHGALSIGSRLNFGMTRGQLPETGDVVNVVITKVFEKFALVEFSHCGEIYPGSLRVTEFKKLGYAYIQDLSSIVHEGDEFLVAIVEYQKAYERWGLSLIPNDIQ